MNDEMPKCKLCGAEPWKVAGSSITMCTGVSCPLGNVPMNYAQWRLLHGTRLAPEHVEALQDAVECVDSIWHRAAIRAALAALGEGGR